MQPLGSSLACATELFSLPFAVLSFSFSLFLSFFTPPPFFFPLLDRSKKCFFVSHWQVQCATLCSSFCSTLTHPSESPQQKPNVLASSPSRPHWLIQSIFLHDRLNYHTLQQNWFFFLFQPWQPLVLPIRLWRIRRAGCSHLKKCNTTLKEILSRYYVCGQMFKPCSPLQSLFFFINRSGKGKTKFSLFMNRFLQVLLYSQCI